MCAQKNELPKYVSASFIPPLGLSEEEKQVWLEITDILRETKGSKMSDADHELILQYCQLKITRDRAWKEYCQNPQRYTRIVTGICADGKTPKVVLKENEHYKTWLECNKYLEQLLREMELNPKSRTSSRKAAARSFTKIKE